MLTSACTAKTAGTSHTAAAPAPVARLWIGGDVFLGSGGRGALAGIAEIVSGAPGIVNLEGPVGLPAGASGEPLRLLHDPSALAELRAAGVAIAGIANNHARDAGDAGGAATVQALTAVGIRPAGGAAGPATLTLGRLRIVVTAHDLEAGVPAGLGAELAAARRRGDVLIATFHVTGPASYLPSPELTEAVAVALDAGATVIAAHGTHELARVERRGRAVIAWGLGNLAFACACTDEQSGALLDVEVGADGAGQAAIVPIDAGLAGGVAHAARDPVLTFELLEAVGSRITRRGARAWL